VHVLGECAQAVYCVHVRDSQGELQIVKDKICLRLNLT
jgi:hypothetical protein